MYLLLFMVLGLALLIGGRLPISRHRHVTGRTARWIGALLLVTPVVAVGVLFGASAVFSSFDFDDEFAETWSVVVSSVFMGGVLLFVGLNLKRWSTMNKNSIGERIVAPPTEHDKGQTNFEFLNDNDSTRSNPKS